MTISSAFEEIPDEAAHSYLKRYFGLGEWQDNEFTGAYFDTFGTNAPNAMTADDVMAIACLSKHVPARAALGILGDYSIKITTLLAYIPPDLSLEDIPFDEHDKYFGDGTPALRLWRLLRRQDSTRWGIGATTASKLMARKRPGLIPIYDSVVGRVTGFNNSDGTWSAWHHAFATDGELVERLVSLRSAAGLQGISLLRVLDVVLWMHGSQGTVGPESVDEAEES
ncbi:DUF6308 family protein [Arthrobacter sp. ISL-28]|uniref:DUF6308 family protein n=1 Tax=Arthrobacter sp. ISL-28 TaxID=2819108 RepID=UPI001BE55E33|nr:DUF6308 family protein [Arthrobacter sp. ISL-28]MBT2519771.1 hypothetical protein [Arthrobacter sp. ISL-28]